MLVLELCPNAWRQTCTRTYPVSSKVFLLRAISASTILMPTSLFGLFGRPNRTMCLPQVDKSVWGRMAFDFSSEFYLRGIHLSNVHWTAEKVNYLAV